MLIFLALLFICFAIGLINFAESSITSLSSAKLKALRAVMGKPFGDAAQRWLNHPEEYLSLLLLVQNILESFFAWLLVMFLALWIADPDERQITAWLVGTVVSLIFLTLYPKLLARQLSQGVLGAWVLRFLYAMLTPLYPMLRVFFKIVAKISGGNSGTLGKGVSMSLEEIRELLDVNRGDGRQTGLTPTLQMMANYLRLKELRVQDIMTRKENVSWIDKKVLTSPIASPERGRAVFSVMTDGRTRTVVLENGLPVGYINARDALREMLEVKDISKARLDDLIRPIPAVHVNQTVLGALPLVLKQSPLAYVADGANWAGIITAEDVLEEITGEILDEFEHRKRKVARPPVERPK